MHTSSAQGALDLIADIGGTNARFALTDPLSDTPELLQPLSLPCADFASLQHAAECYLSKVQVQPGRAAIAVASPVSRDEVRMTNRAWSFSQKEMREKLQLRQLLMLNDFGAVAWSIPALQPDDMDLLHGHTQMPLRGPITVLGPGTGLGIALLVGDAVSDWRVIETEGGHVSFAAQGDEEQSIARWLSARFGRASNERLLSGSGLSHIDAALAAYDAGTPSAADMLLREPPEIVAAALDGHDLRARRTLARFCAVLGSVAGDAALIHGAKTVVIAGGIVPRFLPFLRASGFRERFLAKGRFAAWLESVSVEVVTHTAPGLLGAAIALRRQPEE